MLTRCWIFSAIAAFSPAQTLTTLASFNGGNGAGPKAPLVQGTDGNFYGTTSSADANGYFGSVFKITEAGALTMLHGFSASTTDGLPPFAGLIQGSDGNFYGTSQQGGTDRFGTVFKITPGGTLTTLYSFTGGADGSTPYGALVQATDGNFYGTTYNFINDVTLSGTVFRITGGGAFTTLHTFVSATEGVGPPAGLIQAKDGNLYGTNEAGGAQGYGTVFKITPGGAVTALHAFANTEGHFPFAPVIQGTDGNFYGTTFQGGAYNNGTVFEITPDGTLTTLHSFMGAADGASPKTPVVQATDGNFYGTTSSLGGTVFKVTPNGTFSTVYTFSGPDGSGPGAGLIQGIDGALYGTTYSGGIDTAGSAFKLDLGLPPPSSSSGSAGLKVASVGNGASFTQSFAPGMLMSVFGTGLSTGSPQQVTTAPLPLVASSGTSVIIGGIPAPLLYISATQINLQIPYEVSTGAATLIVSSGGQSASTTFSIQSAAPGIFVDSQTGHMVPHESAAPGSTIDFYLTGVGQVTPSEPTGNVPAAGAMPIPELPFTMTIGGIAVTPVYVAIPEWSVGVLQVNFTVPPTLAPGTYPVIVAIGGVASQPAQLTVTAP